MQKLFPSLSANHVCLMPFSSSTSFMRFFGLSISLLFYFLQKKSIAKSIIIAVAVTPRLASSSLSDDFTTVDIKLVAKCNILFVGLSSGLLLSIVSIPCKTLIAPFAWLYCFGNTDCVLSNGKQISDLELSDIGLIQNFILTKRMIGTI